MSSYSEQSTKVALDSEIAVMVLSNPECTDVELLELKPRQRATSELAALASRWHGRNLQSIGVIGLCAATPRFAFKTDLAPEQLSALADAFVEFIQRAVCDSLAAQQEAELRRMWMLPDTRGGVE
jgi:hypothetical protein